MLDFPSAEIIGNSQLGWSNVVPWLKNEVNCRGWTREMIMVNNWLRVLHLNSMTGACWILFMLIDGYTLLVFLTLWLEMFPICLTYSELNLFVVVIIHLLIVLSVVFTPLLELSFCFIVRKSLSSFCLLPLLTMAINPHH